MPRFLSADDCDLGAVTSVLVVKPSSLGDIVHTLPAVALLKRASPALRVRWVSNPEWMPLLDGHPDVDEVIPFPRRDLGGWNAVAKFWRWSERLRLPETPALALDFQGLLRSAAIARRSGAGLVAGLSDAREGARFLYHRVVRVDPNAHAVDRYLRLPRALGATEGEAPGFRLPTGTMPETPLPDQFVLLHPFARGEGKSLDAAAVRRLCHALAPLPVVLAGKCAPVDLDLPSGTVNLLNRTSLRELIGLMGAACFIVSVDSGPMHMAAALTGSLLSLHAWSDPRKVGPYRRDAWVWKNGRIDSAGEWLKGTIDPSSPENGGVLPNEGEIEAIAAFVAGRVAESDDSH